VTSLDLGRVGIALDVTSDDTYLDHAARLERLGYGALWLPGGQIDRLGRLADLLGATATASVASAIISPDVYDAGAVAQLHADLSPTERERLVVGLGASQRPPALPGLHRYLDALDAAVPAVPAGRRILAALGPRKLEIARDRCSGAITLLVTPGHTRGARAVLGPDPTLVVDQMVVLDTDPSTARTTARSRLRFLATVPGYVANFIRMGFTEAEISGLSDRLVDELVAWGDDDSVAARLLGQLEAGADHVVVTVLRGSEGIGDGDRGSASRPPPLEEAEQLAVRLLPSKRP
jgi:probable F420-dependent oxidoreductase